MKLKLDQGVVISEEDNVEVKRTEPFFDECKSLLLHVVKQAVDDYTSYRYKTREDHQEIWLTASGFLFDSDHYIQWGDTEMNLEQICDVLSLEVEWVRGRIAQQIEVKMKPDGVLAPMDTKNVKKP